MKDFFSQNLARINQTIEKACAQSGRKREDVRLVAVSKTFPAQAIFSLIQCGHRDFGESYYQEARKKLAELESLIKEDGTFTSEKIHLHFIGGLQRNKVNDVVRTFGLIHSVDRFELAAEISKEAAKINHRQKVLIEVNVSREGSKSGVLPEQLPRLFEGMTKLSCLTVKGLMTIGQFLPEGQSEEPRRREFSTLRQLRDNLQDEFGVILPELSMGMSADYPLAIKEGATLIRVGSAIFGKRN